MILSDKLGNLSVVTWRIINILTDGRIYYMDDRHSIEGLNSNWPGNGRIHGMEVEGISYATTDLVGKLHLVLDSDIQVEIHSLEDLVGQLHLLTDAMKRSPRPEACSIEAILLAIATAHPLPME